MRRSSAAISIVPLPGATAAIPALVASGLPTDSFVFVGFLSRKAGDRTRALEDVKSDRRTLIFYEAPHRVRDYAGRYAGGVRQPIDLCGPRIDQSPRRDLARIDRCRPYSALALKRWASSCWWWRVRRKPNAGMKIACERRCKQKSNTVHRLPRRRGK